MKKILLFMIVFFTSFFNVYAGSGLKNIIIDDKNLENFKNEVTTYDLKYESTKENLKIIFDYDKDNYIGKGSSSDIKLNYGTNKITFTVTNKNDSEDVVTYTLNITREDNRSSENSLASLTVAEKKIDITDKTEYDVSVDNSLKSVEIKAVLKDQKSAFVSGYGERIGDTSVKLNGEKTTVEVKVQAENETIKTYKINIIKSNYKNNDATLKSLKIDEINFNFNKTTYEYNLSVPNNIINLKLTAVSNDSKATINYNQDEILKLGVNNIVIKVTAEDGVTTKEYKLNITRLEKEPLVKDIKIEGEEFQFDSNKFNYEIETELESLDFKLILTNENIKYKIVDNENLKNDSIIKIIVEDDYESVTYNFKIKKSEVIDKVEDDENEENKKDDSNNDELNNDNQEENKEEFDINEFLRKYEMYIALGTFGLGLLSLLIAILTKYKDSQIM